MYKKKIIAAVLGVLIAALSFTACGNKADDSNKDKVEKESVSASEKAGQGEEMTKSKTEEKNEIPEIANPTIKKYYDNGSLQWENDGTKSAEKLIGEMKAKIDSTNCEKLDEEKLTKLSQELFGDDYFPFHYSDENASYGRSGDYLIIKDAGEDGECVVFNTADKMLYGFTPMNDYYSVFAEPLNGPDEGGEIYFYYLDKNDKVLCSEIDSLNYIENSSVMTAYDASGKVLFGKISEEKGELYFNEKLGVISEDDFNNMLETYKSQFGEVGEDFFMM